MNNELQEAARGHGHANRDGEDSHPVAVVAEAILTSEGEILEIVEIVVEFREGRHPRHARIYRVLIDEQVVDFHHDSATASDMLRRVGKDSVGGWVLYEVLHGRDVRLDPEQLIHFRRHGLERFHTRKDLVPIEVNQEPKHVRPGRWIVSELKAAVGVPPAKVLAEIKPDGTFDNLDDAAHIEICGGEKFISHARRGGSS